MAPFFNSGSTVDRVEGAVDEQPGGHESILIMLEIIRSHNHYPGMGDRDWFGREASSSAAIIDSQSFKMAERGGPRGFKAGRMPHALVT